jgi:hypothetical protein
MYKRTSNLSTCLTLWSESSFRFAKLNCSRFGNVCLAANWGSMMFKSNATTSVRKMKTANSFTVQQQKQALLYHETSFLASSLPVVIPCHSDSGTSSSYQFFNLGAAKLPHSSKTGRLTTSVDPLENETRSGNQCSTVINAIITIAHHFCWLTT